MTIRVYRVTSAGGRIELGRDEVCLGEPYVRQITLAWPDCACRRCGPPADISGAGSAADSLATEVASAGEG